MIHVTMCLFGNKGVALSYCPSELSSVDSFAFNLSVDSFAIGLLVIGTHNVKRD